MIFYRLIAFDDHSHAAMVRRISDVAFNVKTIRAKLIGLVSTIYWRVDAGHHVLTRPHRGGAYRRKKSFAICCADTANKERGNK